MQVLGVIAFVIGVALLATAFFTFVIAMCDATTRGVTVWGVLGKYRQQAPEALRKTRRAMGL